MKKIISVDKGYPYVIAVDFDGTLCQDKYPDIGKANIEVIKKIKHLKSAGVKFILWTCRSGSMLDAALRWCDEHGLEFDAINDNIIENQLRYRYSSRKISADEYWDDKAVCITCEEDAGNE